MGVDWWDLPGAAPQYATKRSKRGTYGPEVCKVMTALGLPPLPWQQYTLDVAFEHDDHGDLVYGKVIEIVPRQAGKTAKVLGVQVHRALKMAARLGRQRSLYTATTEGSSEDKLFRDHVPLLEASPFASMFTTRRKNGGMGLTWKNGSDHRILATTRKTGHGSSLDLVQIDEAFSLQSNDIEQGVSPTLSTRPSSQLWVLSAAGDDKSPYLREKIALGREVARTGVDDGVAYFEWSADGLDVDHADPEVWAAVHPGVGSLIRPRFLRSEFMSMDPQEFARAYLAVWPTGDKKARIVPEELWSGCGDPTSQCGDPVYFAVDVSPSRDMAAVSAAGRRPDGLSHVELIRHEHGVGWVVPYVQDLLSRHPRSTISVDTVGSAASLLPDFERRRVPVRMLTTSDVARSMGMFLDQVAEGRLRHRDQVSLNVALGSAGRRRIGDKWAWARGDTDITALVSATLALWSMETTIEPKKFKMGLAV